MANPTSNDFDHVRGDRGRVRLVIACAECGHTDRVSISGGASSLPQHTAESNFRNRGWKIGRDRRHDICPHCQQERRARRTGARVEEPAMPITDLPAPASKPAADPPREMSFDERRLIFARLNEVYLDQHRGYDRGWSDAKVADDLGVPLAWVTTIRSENFGHEGSNEDARSIIDEAQVAVSMINEAATDFEKHVATASARIDEATRVIAAHRQIAHDLTKRIDTLESLFRGKGR